MKPRIVFVHGNGTTHWSGSWAGLLKAQLDQRGYPTAFETMPDSILARSEYWLPFLGDHLRVGPHDVIVGWSSGGTAALRYAETHPLRGLVLVSPSCTDLGDDLEKQSGYFDAPWDWTAIRRNAGTVALVSGDDDPYIPQEQFDVIAAATGARAIKVHRGGHFVDRTAFPELLDYITQTYR